MKFHFVDKGPVVRRVDNFIQQINPCPVDKICSLSNQNQERANFIRWIKLYPLFVQPGPGVSILKLDYANYAKRKHLHQQKFANTLLKISMYPESNRFSYNKTFSATSAIHSPGYPFQYIFLLSTHYKFLFQQAAG